MSQSNDKIYSYILTKNCRHMIHITEETSKSFTEYMDPWGDSYTALLTEKNLEEVNDKFGFNRVIDFYM